MLTSSENLPILSVQSLEAHYCVHTVTIESRDERRFWTKVLTLSENECVSV